MKKKNLPLILGSLILILILTIMLFPELFATRSPYTIQHIRFLHDEGHLSVQRAPFSPDYDFMLGSDHLGRDIYSYIIYGTRLTISLGVLIALGQFLVAVPMAMVAGFGNRIAKSIIQQFNVVFSAIPALLIAIILLKLDYFIGLEKKQSIMSFILILTAVSWARLSYLMMERVESIIKQPFIKGEIAIGKTHFRIAIENVLPHLAPELIVLFFMEIARNLSTLMQLGIFAVFVGNLGLINDPSAGFKLNTDISFEPEWASMLSTSRTLISLAPWTVIYPALAFFISVLGFNLFGEGLRNLMQKKDSKAVFVFRKIVTLDFRFFYILFKKINKFGMTLSIGVCILIIGLFSYLYHEDDGFRYDTITNVFPEKTVIGTAESEYVAGLISEYMSQLGVEPLTNQSLLIPYDIGSSYLIEKQKLILLTSNDNVQLNQGTDYAFLTTGNVSESGTIYNATRDDLFNINDFSQYENKYILIDQIHYNDAAIQHIIANITANTQIKGIILVSRTQQINPNYIVNSDDKKVVILISQEASQTIKDNPGLEISVDTTVKPLASSGYNIVGIKRGTDPHIGEEAIVIGMNYNYLDEEGAEVLKFNLKLMEKFCSMDDQKRSIIFMFLDGTINEKQNGIHAIAQDFPYVSQKVQVFLDLTSLMHTQFGEIEYSAAQAPLTRQFAWSMGHHFDITLNQKKYPLKFLETMYIDGSYYFTQRESDNALFWKEGIPTIILGTLKKDINPLQVKDLGNIIVEVVNKNNY
ncbi:MAG: ABC transporter permease [Tissierellales bacterium]|nr:ABC transporter permease [Tissierellales bacterium]MBN2826637.1 ABC transporter permease [Tissierellales bacterium]